jgi:recombination protein RecR
MASVILENLIKGLQKLPGIGPRSAERIAFHLLRVESEEVFQLADSIRDLKQKLHNCTICFNLADAEICNICQNPRRDHSIICVVEQPKDLETIEMLGSYNGVFHVLLGHLAPMEGIGPEDLTISALVERVKKGDVREIIMATNPTLEGDGTALHVAEVLQPFNIRVTRLARGLAVGSHLEYTSKATLADALQDRKTL